MKRWIRKGDKGGQVELVQQRLKDLGFYLKMGIDGDFGSGTDSAVHSFQLKAELNSDGVVGPITWKALGFEKYKLPADKILVPDGLDEIYETFGDPMESGYWKEYGGFCEIPPELNHTFTYTFGGKNGFWCNKLLISVFQRALNSIVKSGLASELKTFDGCFNVRYMRGAKKLSTHSWAIAIDLNASTNRLGAEPKIHMGIVSCFENEGFVWGGRWKRKDGQHLQYAKGY